MAKGVTGPIEEVGGWKQAGWPSVGPGGSGEVQRRTNCEYLEKQINLESEGKNSWAHGGSSSAQGRGS